MGGKTIPFLGIAFFLLVFFFILAGFINAQDDLSGVRETQSLLRAEATLKDVVRDELKPADLIGTVIPGTLAISPVAPSSYALPAIREPSEDHKQAWEWHAQSTFIVQGYPGLRAKYSRPDSLPTRGEARETASMDIYSGFRLWHGAEGHFDLLTWQGFGLNDTLGIEAFPNGEAYKAGTSFPRSNIARLFVRQTINLDTRGGQEFISGDQLTLPNKHDISRLTFTIGRFSLKDIFDNNTYANDPRKQFMNWALMANVAWDYPSDALGYTTGAAIELNQSNWALRYGFFQIDRLRNAWTSEDRLFTWPGYSGAGDEAFWRSWGMSSEVERRYGTTAHSGTIRFLTYLNRGRFGSYQAALSVPETDISQTRAYRSRYGIGLNWEQEITKNIGLFSRIGWNDGHNEAWMFTDINHSASFGISVKGEAWRRSGDTFGVGAVTSGISRVNQEFLAAGGTGILAGDGAVNYGNEKLLETYYDFAVPRKLHAALDYQFIDAPSFNRDRGPVCVIGSRLHWEF